METKTKQLEVLIMFGDTVFMSDIMGAYAEYRNELDFANRSVYENDTYEDDYASSDEIDFWNQWDET